jgi:hypothetical protein
MAFDAKKQADLICEWLCIAINGEITVNKKLLRDMFDVAEGCLHGILNANNNYNHYTFKKNCRYMSRAASKPRSNEKLHREHAIPIEVVTERLYGLRPAEKCEVAEFLRKNLCSVIITEHERVELDRHYRTTMPDNWNGEDAFARFRKREIAGNW